MTITIVEDAKEYEEKIDEFDKNVVKFYKYGKESFLIDKNRNKGRDETAYLHTLQFYCPVLACRVWKELKVSLGVFNTQGVKARNKQSKTAWDHCTNGWKHQRTEQVMRLLHSLFMN